MIGMLEDNWRRGTKSIASSENEEDEEGEENEDLIDPNIVNQPKKHFLRICLLLKKKLPHRITES